VIGLFRRSRHAVASCVEEKTASQALDGLELSRKRMRYIRAYSKTARPFKWN
jgi:hypothetical protein